MKKENDGKESYGNKDSLLIDKTVQSTDSDDYFIDSDPGPFTIPIKERIFLLWCDIRPKRTKFMLFMRSNIKTVWRDTKKKN